MTPENDVWRLNKHVITDCLQLATLYLPTKVTIYRPLVFRLSLSLSFPRALSRSRPSESIIRYSLPSLSLSLSPFLASSPSRLSRAASSVYTRTVRRKREREGNRGGSEPWPEAI